MRIHVLGTVRVDDGATALSPRDRRVLAALVVSIGHEISTEAIADALWGEQPPPSAAKIVQGCVSRLRRLLGAEAITTSSGGYLLDPGAVDLDVAEFDRLVEVARRERRLERSAVAVETYDQALALWRGPALEGLEEWEPARARIAGLHQARLDAEEELVSAALEAGDHERIVGRAVELAEQEPWRERRWGLLALAQYRCGRQADALATLRRARAVLAGQLGVDPGRELSELEVAILNQDPHLFELGGGPVPGDTRCPYPGLEAYDVDDDTVFFGRSVLVGQLVERLDRARVVVLVGDSGTGKSSILRAGVIARLRATGRQVALCVPGEDPEAAALAALAAYDGPTVLAVDQLEESLGPDRAAWLDWLAHHAREVAPVVATLRSDHIGRLATSPALAALAEPGLHLVRALDGTDLREAIEGPAHAYGLRLEPGLVELVLRDAEPGAQPLMSHALAETWRVREGRTLTVAGYQSVGGISGAVARTAERLHDSLGEADRVRLRTILLRLCSIDSGVPSRVRVPLSAFDERGRALVEMLVRARLVTAGEGTAELAHESLVRGWPRLREWLDEDAVGMQVWRHLSRAASGWDDLGRPVDELYRGSRLHVAQEWQRSATATELNRVEADFLAASAAEEGRERAEAEQRQRAQHVSNRRLLRLLVGATVLLVVSLVTGYLAVDRGRDAVQARRASDQTALIQTSLGMRSTDRETAALLALEAYRSDPDAASYSALLGTFTGAPGYLGRTVVDAPEFLEGALVPGSGQQAVVAVGGADLRLMDLESGRLREHFDQPRVERAPYHSELAVSGDGSTLAVLALTAVEEDCATLERYAVDGGSACTTLTVYDLASGDRLAGPLHPRAGGGGDVAVSPRGDLVAVAGGPDGRVDVYRASGRRLGSVPAPPRPDDAMAARDTGAVVFDDAGDLWIGSLGALRHVDLPSMRVDRTVDVPPQAAHNGLVLVDGRTIVGSGDHRLVGVDVADGRLLWQVDVADQIWPCPYLAASSVLGRFYCADFNGGAEERSVETGQLTGRRFDPQEGDPGDLAVGRAGTELVSFSAIRPTYSRWRLDGSGPISERFGDAREVATDAPNPAGLVPTTVLDEQGWPTGRVLVRRLDTGEVVARFDGEWEGFWVGSWLALSNGEREILVSDLDPATAQPLVNPGWPFQTTVDGSRAIIGNVEDDRELRIVDFPSLREEQTFRLPGRWLVNAVRFSLDGERVFFSLVRYDGWKQTYRGAWYDLATRDLHLLDTTDTIAALQTADAETVVTADGGGQLAVRDLELRTVAHLPGARGPINGQQTTDAGLFLVQSSDRSVALYDLPSRRMLGDPVGPGAYPVGAVDVFVPAAWMDGAGDRLLMNDGFPGAMVWDLRPTTLVRAACEVAGRNLTRSEWTTYLGDREYLPSCPD